MASRRKAPIKGEARISGHSLRTRSKKIAGTTNLAQNKNDPHTTSFFLPPFPALCFCHDKPVLSKPTPLWSERRSIENERDWSTALASPVDLVVCSQCRRCSLSSSVQTPWIITGLHVCVFYILLAVRPPWKTPSENAGGGIQRHHHISSVRVKRAEQRSARSEKSSTVFVTPHEFLPW